MVLATVMAGPLLALAQSKPRAGEIIVVASPPCSEAPAVVVERAGGTLVGPDATPIAVLAIVESADFVERPRACPQFALVFGTTRHPSGYRPPL
jgi:hypothetical protein